MIKSVFFFKNGNTAVFDDKGQQVETLQEAWLIVYLHYLKSKGADISGIHFSMPDGKRAEIFTNSEGEYNWRIK